MKYELSEKENEAFKKWSEKHAHKELEPTAIGGKFTFLFTPTGIGTAVEVICVVCNERINITDYDSW